MCRALIFIAAVALPRVATGYDRYANGCSDCHEGFASSPYQPPGGGAAWADSLHAVHRDGSHMGTECDLCHTSGDGWNVRLGSSDGTGGLAGLGCKGCHAREGGAGVTAIGLRARHEATGASTCSACHPGDPAAPAESVLPPYYGSSSTRVSDPCNGSDESEDWSGDGQGLDNDGDLVRDLADPDCGGGEDGGAGGDGGTPGDGGGNGGGLCGNGVLDDGETCDPPESCPDSCDDDDPCTVDRQVGSAAMCSIECLHEGILCLLLASALLPACYIELAGGGGAAIGAGVDTQPAWTVGVNLGVAFDLHQWRAAVGGGGDAMMAHLDDGRDALAVAGGGVLRFDYLVMGAAINDSAGWGFRLGAAALLPGVTVEIREDGEPVDSGRAYSGWLGVSGGIFGDGTTLTLGVGPQYTYAAYDEFGGIHWLALVARLTLTYDFKGLGVALSHVDWDEWNRRSREELGDNMDRSEQLERDNAESRCRDDPNCELRPR